MKDQLLIATLFLSLSLFGQTTLEFSYDNEGNQISRTICMGCLGKTAKDSIITLKTIPVEDLITDDSSAKALSYYPNPVSEELYINWVNEGQKYVKNIQLFSSSGQMLQKFNGLQRYESKAVPFGNLPAGFYNVVLAYSTGEKKVLKIVKK